MKPWDDQIEDDLKWREAEIAALKLLAATAQHKSIRQRAILRSLCAMVYAHYEGFCKFCWTLLLEAIESQGCERRLLAEPIVFRSMQAIFKDLRAKHSDKNLWNFATYDFQRHLSEKAIFSKEIDTESNLWPGVAMRINESVGIKCVVFNEHRRKLGLLLQRRNDIAHGEKIEIDSIQQMQELINVTTTVMHGLAVEVIDCLEKKKFLRT